MNTRGLNLLSIVAKLYTGILNNRLINFWKITISLVMNNQHIEKAGVVRITCLC